MFSLIKNESWGLEDDQIPSSRILPDYFFDFLGNVNLPNWLLLYILSVLHLFSQLKHLSISVVNFILD